MAIIYFRKGNKPANPVNQTNNCNHCEPTMEGLEFPDLTYDSEKDANTTFKAFGDQLLKEGGKAVWDKLWQNFKCTNQQCSKKAPCGNKPIYLEAGVDPVRDAKGNLVWQFYVILAREIQCIPADGKPPEDLVPQILDSNEKSDRLPKKMPGNEPPEKRGLSMDFRRLAERARR